MEDKIKKQSIDRLNISVSILEGLKQNNIIRIEDKCSFFYIFTHRFQWTFLLYLENSFYIKKKYNDNLKKILYNNKRNFNKGV